MDRSNHKSNENAKNTNHTDANWDSNQLEDAYETSNNCTVWIHHTDKGIRSTRLCNFTATIVMEEIQDDGADKKTAFIIEGITQDNRMLDTAMVPSDKYAAMGWINANWGAQAILFAGHNKKDHLRVAIQTLSGRVPQRTVHTYVGWKEQAGRWMYLNANGAVDEAGLNTTVQVAPSGVLKHYALPPLSTKYDLQEAIKESLSILNLAPLTIMSSLLAAIYRAPLGEACDIDFAIFLVGPSGCQKSECLAIAQSHFGRNFKRTTLPGNWSSTANSLERQAFLAKDSIFAIDDFAPTGSAVDVARFHKDADRIFRGQGNKAGRGRLTAEAQLHPQYFPRGLIISSGEDIPKGPSLRARALIIEISRGDINLDHLTRLQNAGARGAFSKSMAGYVQWLAPKIDEMKALLPLKHQSLRSNVRLTNSHARTPDIVISLGLGLDCFLSYALESGAIDSEKRAELWQNCWGAINDVACVQHEFQDTEDPAIKFIELLKTAIVSGQAHLANIDNGMQPINAGRCGWRPGPMVIRHNGVEEPEYWRPLGNRIGWIDGCEILLDPGASYGCAQEVARKQNDALPTSDKTLWKRLIQKGIAIKGETSKNTCKKTIMGIRQRVLVIRNVESLYGAENRDNGDFGDNLSLVKVVGS